MDGNAAMKWGEHPALAVSLNRQELAEGRRELLSYAVLCAGAFLSSHWAPQPWMALIINTIAWCLLASVTLLLARLVWRAAWLALSDGRWRNIPLTRRQRQLLHLSDSVGRTVDDQERLRISPRKMTPAKSPASQPANLSRPGTANAGRLTPVTPHHCSLTTPRPAPASTPRSRSSLPTTPVFGGGGGVTTRSSPISSTPAAQTPQRNTTPRSHVPSSPANSLSALKEMMAVEKERESIQRATARTWPASQRDVALFYSGAGGDPSTPPNKFQPATRSPVEFTAESAKRRAERKTAPKLPIVPFDDIIARLKIAKALLLSSGKIRTWIHENVVKQLAAAVRQAEETRVAVPALDAYLSVPRTPNTRAYTSARIKALAAEVDMGTFTWNNGMAPAPSQQWTDRLPSDAEIVFHLFACYMDTKMSALGVYAGTDRPFSARYVCYMDDLTDSSSKQLCLQVDRRFPLKVNVRADGELWHVFEGRNNVLYAIVLFLRHCQLTAAGYLE